jgi:hypothetical protein
VDSGVFILEFLCDTSIDAPTEIYLNSEYHYPTGYKISISHDVEVSDHDLQKTMDSSNPNYMKIQFSERRGLDEPLGTMMTTLIFTRKWAHSTGSMKSHKMKMFYEVVDNTEGTNKVIFHVTQFNKFNKYYRVKISDRHGKTLCSFKSHTSGAIEECSGPTERLINANIKITNERAVIKSQKTVFNKTLKGLNNQKVQLRFAWK